MAVSASVTAPGLETEMKKKTKSKKKKGKAPERVEHAVESAPAHSSVPVANTQSRAPSRPPNPDTLEENWVTVVKKGRPLREKEGQTQPKKAKGLEPRLNPAPLLRPPLAADTAKRGKKVVRNPPVLPAVVTPVAPVVTAAATGPEKDTRRRKEKKNTDGPSRPQNPDTLEENWVTVAKKKKKKEDKTQPRTGPAPKPKKSPQAKSKPKPKLRMPRSSAVVITLTDEEGLEPRLNPAPLLRPPLAADKAKKGKERAVRNPPVLPAVVTPVAPVVTAVDSRPEKVTRRGKEKKTDGPSRPLNPDTLEENWVTVAKKTKKKEDRTQPRTGPAPKPKKSPQAKSKPKPKLRMPRSSAVVITLTDEGKEKMTYSKRTVCEETRVLSAENQRLREKLEELTRKVENLQKSSGSPNMEELEASLLRKLGDKMNARIEGLEPRLNPAPLLRPPLAADRRRKEKETVTPATSVATVVASLPEQKKKAKKAKDKEDPRPPNPDSLEGTWASVVKRKKKKEKSHPQPAPGKAPNAKKSPKAKAKPKLKTPRSSAIVLTLTDEGKEKAMLTYQKALLIARGSYGNIGRRRPRRRYARASCATSALGSGLGKGLADTSPLTEQSSGRRALGWFSG
ncbi:unnamed protein product [Leptosia nina]|uniref:Uncharacterized protein n=1 Tax=Leptosia nina TaxID=320188 RepID=A0AAV1JJB2_9NEOP